MGPVAQEDDDPLARDAAQLAEAGAQVAPALDGVDGQSGVVAVVGQRQLLGAGLQRRRRAGRTLGDHGCRRLDGQHLEIVGLVGARPGADESVGLRGSEGCIAATRS